MFFFYHFGYITPQCIELIFRVIILIYFDLPQDI